MGLLMLLFSHNLIACHFNDMDNNVTLDMLFICYEKVPTVL